jgi:hypothetical protein
VSDYVIPPPEPQEVDEKVSMELRILVGADWWCQWWDADPDDDRG